MSGKTVVLEETPTYRGSFMKRQENEEAEIKKLEEANKPQSLEETPEQDDLPAVGTEEETWKKRYGDLRRHEQKKSDGFKTQVTKLEKKVEELTGVIQNPVTLPKTEDEVAEWSKEYPEVAAVIKTMVVKQSQEDQQRVKSQFEEISEEQQQLARDRAEVKLLQRHPDYSELRGDEEFHAWAAEQPKSIQDTLYDNDTDWEACARVIDLYKLETAPKRGRPTKEESEKRQQKDAASLVKTPSKKQEPGADDGIRTFKESEIQAMSASEYESLEDAIQKANQAGKIILDVSGSAR